MAWPILGAILNSFVSGLIGFAIAKKIGLTVGLEQPSKMVSAISATTMITAKARHHFLETIPIFAGLNAGSVSEIAAAVQEMGFLAGDIIVREGEPGNRMFIIHSGRVEVVKHLALPHETVLAVLGSKDFLGEMSIIECVARSASVRAVEDTSLLALTGTDLYRLFQHHSDQYAIVILNIARDLSRRLRTLDEKFSAISH